MPATMLRHRIRGNGIKTSYIVASSGRSIQVAETGKEYLPWGLGVATVSRVSNASRASSGSTIIVYSNRMRTGRATVSRVNHTVRPFASRQLVVGLTYHPVVEGFSYCEFSDGM